MFVNFLHWLRVTLINWDLLIWNASARKQVSLARMFFRLKGKVRSCALLYPKSRSRNNKSNKLCVCGCAIEFLSYFSSSFYNRVIFPAALNSNIAPARKKIILVTIFVEKGTFVNSRFQRHKIDTRMQLHFQRRNFFVQICNVRRAS